LTSIINYVDLIKREHLQNEKVQEYLNILDQKSQRLKTLTEDLLEASKASSGTLKLDMIHLDLVEMIWQTNGEFEEKFTERKLELVSHLPNDNIIIEADGRHLWRVLENLYNNAFKYAMEHSRIFAEITCENDYAYFTLKNVSEHPLNVSSEDLTERFVRGDVSRTTEGSGLGLSIAQSLTKLQGGTFEILIDADLYKVRIGFPIVKK
jgi:signal transduction histidine kinase